MIFNSYMKLYFIDRLKWNDSSLTEYIFSFFEFRTLCSNGNLD